MTDKQTLFQYRLRQAEETFAEVKKMTGSEWSPRSIINRAYYSMFYILLALFLKTDIKIKTSKHVGVISMFDKEFVKTGKIDKYYSAILHDIFDARLEADYKELTEYSDKDAVEFVEKAEEFLGEVKRLIQNG